MTIKNANFRSNNGHLSVSLFTMMDLSRISPSQSSRALFPLSASIWTNNWSIILPISGMENGTVSCPLASNLFNASSNALLYPGTTGKNVSSLYLKI